MERIKVAKKAGRVVASSGVSGNSIRSNPLATEKLFTIPDQVMQDPVSPVAETPLKKRKVETSTICSLDPEVSQASVEEGGKFMNSYADTLGKPSDKVDPADLAKQNIFMLYEVSILL